MLEVFSMETGELKTKCLKCSRYIFFRAFKLQGAFIKQIQELFLLILNISIELLKMFLKAFFKLDQKNSFYTANKTFKSFFLYSRIYFQFDILNLFQNSPCLHVDLLNDLIKLLKFPISILKHPASISVQKNSSDSSQQLQT